MRSRPIRTPIRILLHRDAAPNVTGALHHGARFERFDPGPPHPARQMKGYEALWLPGLDHASIASRTSSSDTSCARRQTATTSAAWS